MGSLSSILPVWGGRGVGTLFSLQYFAIELTTVTCKLWVVLSSVWPIVAL